MTDSRSMAEPVFPRGVCAKRLEGYNHRRNKSADLRDMEEVREILSENSVDMSTGKKLSVTRGVNLRLPNISQMNHTKSDGRVAEHMNTPPLTESPIGNEVHQVKKSSERSNADYNAKIEMTFYFSNTHVCLDPSKQLSSRFTALHMHVIGGRVSNAEFLLQLVAAEYGIDGQLASETLSLWMESKLFEVQLKVHHGPYDINRSWPSLLKKFTEASEEEQQTDKPMLVCRRNAFLTIEKECQVIQESLPIREILFNDAHDAFLSGRYPCDADETAELAGMAIPAIYEKYQKEKHNIEFLRREFHNFVPEHMVGVLRGAMVFGKCIQGETRYETILLNAWQAASAMANEEIHLQFLRKLHTKPYYGATFFNGSIERLKKKWLGNGDLKVLVGVSQQSITIIDEQKKDFLLVQNIDDCTWRRSKNNDGNDTCEPSLLLYFPKKEETKPKGKIVACEEQQTMLLQIFSRQAVLMDALMTSMQAISVIPFESTVNGTTTAPISTSSATKNMTPSRPEYAYSSSPPSSADSNGRGMSRCASLTRPNKMCLATFNSSSGHCLTAQGSLKQVLLYSNA